MYAVKEIYYTLQGEGHHTGRPAIFCRFAGCNLWTGSEAKRASSLCNFCDTDFVGVDGHLGGRYQTLALADRIASQWPSAIQSNHTAHGQPMVVLTGGEPMLQVDETLLDALHDKGFFVAIETNGTLPVPAAIDWICVSPKGQSNIVQTTGNELKLVYPQQDAMPEQFAQLKFKHYYLQPKDTAFIASTDGKTDFVQQTIDYCLHHPQWQLSLQTHKITGIP